ncbi:oligosaccharide flippase family protein [Pseudoalteromonas sp. FUC4]|uniref:oligosaccharide flippase family protein n=1 Tax=Pseudoalteromonas sp. FUC4 TaxID=2511201 RepID=UPI00165E0485|nr:oligosaccharide flippase family protein [Pseudoalteromonas sp. FUC4]
MSLRAFLKGSSILSLGQIFSQLTGLIRNSLIGHAVSPEDFGRAAVFALVVSLVESISEISADKLILQYKYGGNKKVISGIHFLNICKGTLCSILIILLHPVFLYFFEMEEASWGLYLVAVVPFIKGFVNFDFIRKQRELEFIYLVKLDFFCQLTALFIAYITLEFIVDYRVSLFAILAQALSYTLYSHWQCKQGYSAKLNKPILIKTIKFGWPLLINGLGLFLILQGDKFIVSKFFSMDILGYFAALTMLALMPAVIITKVLMSTLLPIYSNKNHKNNLITSNIPYFLSFLYIIYIVLFGDFLIDLVFGPKYLKQDYIFILLGCMWFFRLLQAKIVIKEISIGNTRTPLYATLIRLSFVPISFVFVLIENELSSIVYSGILGEMFALLYLLSLRKRSALYVYNKSQVL